MPPAHSYNFDSISVSKYGCRSMLDKEYRQLPARRCCWRHPAEYNASIHPSGDGQGQWRTGTVSFGTLPARVCGRIHERPRHDGTETIRAILTRIEPSCSSLTTASYLVGQQEGNLHHKLSLAPISAPTMKFTALGWELNTLYTMLLTKVYSTNISDCQNVYT
jgi:hypothetical protein